MHSRDLRLLPGGGSVHACTLTRRGTSGPESLILQPASYCVPSLRACLPRSSATCPQGSCKSRICSNSPCLSAAVLRPVPPRYRSHRHARLSAPLLINYPVWKPLGIFQMSAERPTSTCGVPLLPAISERPDDECDYITRSPSDADKFFTFFNNMHGREIGCAFLRVGKNAKGR
jgi:hypothetical protein